MTKTLLPAHARRPHPFPFVGHGVHADYKCLECYLWLEEPPPPALARKITSRIPAPLRSFARWEGAVLHFGSDDALEAYVRASYAPQYRKMPYAKAVATVNALYGKPRGYEPTAKEWAAFSKAIETFGREVNEMTPVRALLRPSGEGHGAITPWHTWSVARVLGVLRDHAPKADANAAKAKKATIGKSRAAKRKGDKTLAWIAALLMQVVIEEQRLGVEVREALVAWLDYLLPSADEYGAEVLAQVAMQKPRQRQSPLAVQLNAAARAVVLRHGGRRATAVFGGDAVDTALASDIATIEPKNAKAAIAFVRARVTRMREAGVDGAVAIGEALLANAALQAAIALVEKEAFAEYGDSGIIALDSSPSVELYNMSYAHHTKRDFATASRLLELALRFPHPIYWTYNNLVLAYVNQKRFAEAARIADAPFVRKTVCPNLPDSYHNTACAYAGVGRIDDALRDVELAKKSGCSTMSQMPTDEDLRALWNEPRFKKLFA